ncbi:hypothetical protein BDA96_06G016700 [Sorghum bicolor]|uniref:DUF4220 domain-containing protein n=1 Tax=Sorghum bicolor TaxID=4558 RepID=A0A921QNG0_SORBI|nr:hypothetical protein BDA96_06G016700 [Sorghum bicolor]
MAFRPLEVWNRWAIQILLLLSLGMHVLLLPLAGIRRRRAPMLLRVPLWLAYHLADTIGIYAIGLLSLSSAPREHRLMPFWAPFLLLHRGGPDSIGAYAFHDNQLWLRHLQLFVVNVMAVTYVLYIHLTRGDAFLAMAALLMFAVGVAKYGEKVAAIRGGNKNSIRSSLTKQPTAGRHHHVHHWDHGLLPNKAAAGAAAVDEEEAYLRHAHHMFHMSKRATVDSWLEKDPEHHTMEMLRALRKQDARGMWAFAELQLSLLYDVLYTKAAVIHTWPGYLLRLASSLAIAAAAFLLFRFSGRDDVDDDVVDVVVTYVLLAGAFVMEVASVMNALGSSWTYAFLCTTRWSSLRYTALCTGRWDRLRQLVKTIHGRSDVSVRRWSGEMGQYNMFHFCSRHRRAHRPLAGRIAMAMGFEDWWNRKHYSATANISDELRQELFRYVQRLTETGLNSQGVIRKSWGQEALERDDKGLYERIKRDRNLGVEFQEGVIIWHIGTDIFLARSRSGIEEAAAAGGGGGDDAAVAAGLPLVVKMIRTLSNYMMFLLVNHPNMLPGLAQGMVYRRTCENLSDRSKTHQQGGHVISREIIGTKLREMFCLQDGPASVVPADSHVHELANKVYEEMPKYSQSVPRLCYANGVAVELLGRVKEKGVEAVLRLLRDVWMDFVVYAANRCSRESHAKKLSSGGELTSVVWIMADFLNQEAYARQKD